MPFKALKRIKFGEGYIEAGSNVPIVPGRNYAKLEKLGLVKWSLDGETAPVLTKQDATKPVTPEPVAIPEDWRDLHWTKKVKLAGELTTDEIKTKDEAEAVIAAVEARRITAAAHTDQQQAPADDTDEPVAIPENWRELPEQERIALAAKLTGDPSLAHIGDADAFIELEAESRKAST